MKNLLRFTALAAIALLVPLGALAQGTIPANTSIIVVLDHSVSSKDAKLGDRVTGTVADSFVVRSRTVIPRGARAHMTVVSVEPSGRLKGVAKLWLRLNSVEVNGKTHAISTNASGQTGENHNKRNVIAIGGGTAAGAAIGGAAGGGKGAAIGAVVGAVVGTAGAAATGKKDVEFPAETKLRFTTRTATTIR